MVFTSFTSATVPDTAHDNNKKFKTHCKNTAMTQLDYLKKTGDQFCICSYLVKKTKSHLIPNNAGFFKIFNTSYSFVIYV